MDPVRPSPATISIDRYDFWERHDAKNSRIQVTAGAADTWGRVPLYAALDDRLIHMDRIDVASEAQRRRFAKTVLDRSFGVEPLDENEFRGMEVLIFAAIDKEQRTWTL